MRARIPDYGVSDGAVVLQHSSATAALYGYLLDKPAGYGPKEAAALARHESNLASLMTAPVRVLTPYQLLRAFFGLPGHEAILTDAAGGLFVLDELHAYDVGRLALILAAVRRLRSRSRRAGAGDERDVPSVLAAALDDALGGAPTRIDADEETMQRFVRHAATGQSRPGVGGDAGRSNRAPVRARGSRAGGSDDGGPRPAPVQCRSCAGAHRRRRRPPCSTVDSRARTETPGARPGGPRGDAYARPGRARRRWRRPRGDTGCRGQSGRRLRRPFHQSRPL